MLCPSCRQEASGASCDFCGTALAAAPTGPAAISSKTAEAGLSPNTAAAIAYLTILPSILFLVLKQYRRIPLVRFHSVQNIAFFVAAVIVYSGLTAISFAVSFVPYIGFLFLFLDLSVGIFFVVGWLVALIKANQGEAFRLPVIGAVAAKLAGV